MNVGAPQPKYLGMTKRRLRSPESEAGRLEAIRKAYMRPAVRAKAIAQLAAVRYRGGGWRVLPEMTREQRLLRKLLDRPTSLAEVFRDDK